MKHCEGFLVSKGLVNQGEIFSAMPHPNAPVYIVAWIMDRWELREVVVSELN